MDLVSTWASPIIFDGYVLKLLATHFYKKKSHENTF